MTFCASSSTIRVQPQPVRTDSACSKTRTQSQEQKAGHSFDARVQRHASGGTEGRCLQNIIKQQLGSIVKGETGSRHGTSSRCDSSRHEKAAGGSESAGRQGARCAGEDGSRTQQRWGGGHFGHVGSGRLESGHHAHGSRTEGGRGGQCVRPAEGGTVQATDEGVTLQVKGLLQGAYRANTGLMTDALREQSLLPEDQPYQSLGYNGTETLSATTLATTGNNAPVDWVLVELRDVNNPDTVISSQAAIIQRDGDVAKADTNTTDLHFDVPAGEYFVTLAHRNHLDVTTTSAVSLSGTDGTLVDFTNPDTISAEAFTVVDGQAALWAGDANGDNSVTAFGPGNDANSLLSDILKDPGNINGSFEYVASGYLNSDLDLNGVTNQGDNSDRALLNSNTATEADNSTGSGNYVIKGTTERA